MRLKKKVNCHQARLRSGADGGRNDRLGNVLKHDEPRARGGLSGRGDTANAPAVRGEKGGDVTMARKAKRHAKRK